MAVALNSESAAGCVLMIATDGGKRGFYNDADKKTVISMWVGLVNTCSA